MAEDIVHKSLAARRGWLMRGESAIASVGLAVAALLIAAMAACSWWTLRTQKDAFVIARVAQIRALGDVLSQSAETMLAGGDLSALRRIILEARAKYDLLDCQVLLPDGKTLASSDPARITQVLLPAHWSGAVLDETVNSISDEQVAMAFPFRVPGRGGAMLAITAPIEYPQTTMRQTQTGVALIGAAALAALILVYRKSRARILALGSIREALLATQTGESSPDAMTLGLDHGPETKAWNQLVAATLTLRKKSVAERALASLDQRQEGSAIPERICDALSQGLIMVDEQARVSYANGAAAVALQMKREQLLGADILAALPEESLRQAVRTAVDGSVRARKTLQIERKGDGGESVLRFGIRPLKRESTLEVMILIEDITQQRVAEESRNNFVAHAAHELRTPLTNIRLYVETALDVGEKDPVERTKALNVINQESRRLELVIGEMLSASEIEAGSLKIRKDDVRLDNLFTELENDYRAQAADKQISLAFELPPKLPVIQADREKFAMALHNLLGNALKYTPKAGRVTVSVKQTPQELAVAFADTGIGIDEEELERIFDRFYRSKDPRVHKITGTGLGLTLAREVIRQHGGEVTAQSHLNVGSTFTVTMPLVKES